MRYIQLIGLVLFSTVVQAQTSGTMQVHLEVLPRVLTVSVSSSQLDFAQQRADAGNVMLDPATGLVSGKSSGTHALGEVIVRGPAKSGFLVSVEQTVQLRQHGSDDGVDFTPLWAQSEGCHQGAFALTPARRGTGTLGADGCAALRFGGTIQLWGAAQGRYAGQLAVRIAPL
ncbi:MAG: hypothetical protein OXD43_05620 [Bacteroidetes bacterium]|nr:hypothetical protein [Bacteroidota bacterium]